MPTVQERLETATAQAEEASGILHDVVSGGPEDSVPTPGGLVPSLQKWFADRAAEFLAWGSSLLADTTAQKELAVIARDEAEGFATSADESRQSALDSKNSSALSEFNSSENASSTAADRIQTGLNATAAALSEANAEGSELLSLSYAQAAQLSALLSNQFQANRGSVRAVTTAPLPAFTVSGGGTIFTANANGALSPSVTDGVTLVAGDRIWHADPTGVNSSNVNYGLLSLQQQGTAGLPAIFVRSTDADSAAELGYSSAQIREGLVYAGAKMRVTNDPGAITLGSTPITVVLDSNAAATPLSDFVRTYFETRKIAAGGVQPLFRYQDGKIPVGLQNGDLWFRGLAPNSQVIIKSFLESSGVLVSDRPAGWPAFAIYEPVSGRTYAIVRPDGSASWYGHFRGAVEALSYKGASRLRSDGRNLYAALAKLSSILANNSGVAKIAITGDSWTERWLIVQMLALLMYLKYGQAGDGWVSLNATGTVQNETSLKALNAVTVTHSGLTLHDISEEAKSGQYSHDGFRFDAAGFMGVTSLVWSAGTVTAVLTGPHGIATGNTTPITLAGATPAGYNGSYTATAANPNTLTFPLASNPGAATVRGTVQFTSGNHYPFSVAITGIRCTGLSFPYIDTQASFLWRVDGGAWTLRTGGNTGLPTSLDITGLSAGTHVLEIDGTANARPGSFAGVYGSSVGMTGVEFSKMGNGGSTAPQIASVQGDAFAQFILNKIRPDATICILGTNDNRLDVKPEEYKAGLATIVSAHRAPNSNCGVVMVAPPANGIGGTYPMTDYRDQVVDVANEQSADYVNLTSAWSDYTKMAAQGSWFDTLHVSYGGARWIASSIFESFSVH